MSKEWTGDKSYVVFDDDVEPLHKVCHDTVDALRRDFTAELRRQQQQLTEAQRVGRDAMRLLGTGSWRTISREKLAAALGVDLDDTAELRHRTGLL